MKTNFFGISKEVQWLKSNRKKLVPNSMVPKNMTSSEKAEMAKKLRKYLNSDYARAYADTRIREQQLDDLEQEGY